MYKHYITLSFLLTFGLCSLGKSQIVISEVISDSLVELHNQGLDTLDINDYWLCNRPQYNRIGSLNALCGTFNMSPGAYLVVNANFSISRSGDELGVYSTGDFADSLSILDYVIWGDRAGSTRESVAVSAGIWTDGERATAFDESNSLLYDGDGDSASDYYIGVSNQCAENIAPCNAIGGTIATSSGQVDATICVDDGLVETVQVTLIGNVGTNSAWIVTDTAMNILSIDTSNTFDFEDAGPGICLIWHLSYEDGLEGAVIDSNAANLSGCFNLSNSITVTKLTGEDCPVVTCDVVGGSIVNQDETETSTLCVDDGNEELVIASVSGATGSDNLFIVTDTNQTILNIETNTNVFSLEPAGVGVCLIWHVSFEGSLQGLEIGNNRTDITGCFGISNSIRVIRLGGLDCTGQTCDVTAGSIVNQDGTTSSTNCVSDDDEELVIASLSGGTGSDGMYIVSDPDSVILLVETNTNVFNLEQFGEGTCFLSHITFIGTLSGAERGNSISDLTGCFALSNSIEVVRLGGANCPAPPCDAAGGAISTSNGELAISVCTDDSPQNIEVNLSNAIGSNSTWVVTDTLGKIIRLDSSNIFNFDSSAIGTCLIRHLSYEDGLIGAAVDSNIANLVGCFGLSNSLTVTKLSGEACPPPPCEVEGGILLLAQGGASIEICVGDGISDSLQITIDSALGTNEAWVITDTAGIIIELPTGPPFDFENQAAGTCLIRHIAFDGALTGLSLSNSIDSIQGCFGISNAITVSKVSGDDCPPPPCPAIGGTISTVDNLTDVSLCMDEARQLELSLSGQSGTNSAWVVTDTNMIITNIDTSNIFTFDSSDIGVCLIWHLSFEEGITGVVVDSSAANISGCFGLSNSITVTKLSADDCTTDTCDVIAGNLTFANGSTSVEICSGDGISDLFEVSIDSAQGENEAWVITDTAGIIIGLPTSPPFELEGQLAGTCSIWHVVFEGSPSGLAIGAEASNIEGCVAFSNPLTIVKVAGEDCPPPPCDAEGGSITLSDGETEISLCLDDEESNEITVNLSGQVGTNSAWVTTDTNLTILSIDTSNIFNFDSAQSGICLIWHLSYEDGLDGAEVGSNAANLSGCSNLSNSITVTKLSGDDCPFSDCNVVGGSLTTTDGATDFVVCGGTGSPSLIDVVLSGSEGSRSAWLITDTEGVILGFPLSPPFNLTGANIGNYQIWHLSYDGSISGASLGANAEDLEGCLALSNPLSIQRIDINPSYIHLGDSIVTADICVGTDNSQPLEVLNSDGSGPLQSWVVTDTNGIIINLPESNSIDFNNAGDGICVVWLLDHASDLAGLTIEESLDDLTGCYALSNSVTVNRTEVNGGFLNTNIGTDEIEICISDTIPDMLSLVLTEEKGANSSYILTDTSGTILQVSESSDFDFANDSTGICQIWHVSYEEGLAGLQVGAQVQDLSGCFDISNSFTITKLSGEDCPEPCNTAGGFITTQDGQTEITICVDDNINDNFDLNVEGAVGEFFGYVVTDDENNILGIEETFRVNLEGTGAGKILVRYIAYDRTANIPEEGGNINTLSGCYALSNTFTINRVIEDDCEETCLADGGQISIEGADELIICTDDGESDVLEITLVNNAGESNTFLITDQDNIILSLFDSPTLDLEGEASGTCHIRHLSYIDSISGLEVGGHLDDLIGCFSISDPITVAKITGLDCPQSCSTDGGSINVIDGGDVLEFCAGEVVFSVFHETSSEDSLASYWYVVTDESGSILQWQNSEEGGAFDLSRDPGGVCRVYGYHTLDESILEEGLNIDDLTIDCGSLSSNYVTITKNVGGECDEGCHTPRDVRLRRNPGSNTWTIRWDRVDDATGFTVLIGYQGSPGSFSEVPVRRNRITLTGPPNRTMVVSIRTECRFGERSAYTREYILEESESDFRSDLSQTRTAPLQHGTVLPSGIVISEQALAFPNPASDRITIWHDANGQKGHISIYDQTGKLLIQQKLNGDEEFQDVNVSELFNGLYFILVESQGDLIMQDKLIINNGR